MDSKKDCSGFYFFIQDKLAKLRLAKTPYTGSNAYRDFAKEWDAINSC